MTGARRRFTVSVPDWGQDHLSSDAIVAYVDDELANGPHTRATQHIAACPECAAQVRAQGQASSALRTAGGPCLPTSLMSALRSIPLETELPQPPAGLAMSPEGQLVNVLRPESMLSPAQPALDPDPVAVARAPRRFRFGATIAVSGIALVAGAFGVAAIVAGASEPATPPDRGVLGPASGGVEANLRPPLDPGASDR